MADAFLDRFYRKVARLIGDPSVSARYTRSAQFEDLQEAQVAVWESLLRAGGQESAIGRAEATITLTDGVAFYRLPGNFRQFLKLEYWAGGDRNKVLDALRSRPTYDTGRGVEILDGQRGMLLHPVPTLSADEDWTLIYQKGPVTLHYATAGGLGSRTLLAGTPPADAGERVDVDDYYNGCLIRVFSAERGAPQINEVLDYDAASSPPVFHLRNAWSPIPSGTVQYEICPALPAPHDVIYAYDAALKALSPRNLRSIRRNLLKDREPLWSACLSYFGSNVADRMPARTLPPDPGDCDPYEDT